eukprot:gene9964-10119_t
MAALASQHGIPTLPTDVVATTLYTSNGQLVPTSTSQEYEELYQLFCQDIEVLQKDANCQVTSTHLSVADVRQQFMASQQLTAAQQQGCNFLINRWIEQEYGADAAELSALYFNADEPNEGDDVLFPGGYSQVLEAVSSCLKPGCVLLQHEVQKIQYTNKGAAVHAQTQQGLVTFWSQYVVVTFPLGVLKKHVVLLYDKSFWAATPWLNRMPGEPNDGRWMEMFNLELFVPQLPALVAFNAARAAWTAERDSDEELTQQARDPRALHLLGMLGLVTDILGLMYPEAAAAAKCPKQVVVTRWGQDPWALGSYACMAVGSSLKDLEVLAEPVNDVLHFAGEAMSVTNQGTVHGAYQTGVAAAHAILAAEQRRQTDGVRCM